MAHAPRLDDHRVAEAQRAIARGAPRLVEFRGSGVHAGDRIEQGPDQLRVFDVKGQRRA
jgi:hypothetical protein